MLHVEENVSIKNLTTFGLDARVRYYCSVTSVEELKEALTFARAKHVPFMVLGGGSNSIFNDQEILDLCLIKMDITGFTLESGQPDDNTHVWISVGAGMNWDDVVSQAVAQNLGGLEALSAIPGSAGATPVQNVGAYGVEIKDVIERVEVLNTETLEIKSITNTECQFAYRDSIFKHREGKKYIILSIMLRLSKNTPISIPNYPGVGEYFEKKGIVSPTLLDVRNAITAIRWTKLPDPKVLASCGSFFKNPIVKNSVAEKLKENYPNAVVHDVGGGFSKVGAGWLIDSLGLKGQQFGNLLIYDKNALVLANQGGATKAELDALVLQIQSQVYEKFSIRIEPEPVFV